MIKIRVSESAEQDYLDSIRWYAERSRSAAFGFESEIDVAFQKIAIDPHRFPRYDNFHRSLLVARYPFQVIYRILDNDVVVIVAIAHASRRPGYWKRS